ncbi:MAG: immune inhibitor A, partial [Chitinispirillia bacterium]
SGADAWAWRGISQKFEIPSGGATLKFQTYFEIEDDWDYGYVEVYDHNTGEWYTLDGPGTTNTLPFPQDNPNVPAEREPTAYFDKGRWHAFTGKSEDWQEISMDLSPFAGHSIDICFRSWQDGAFTYQMMYVDDISIPEIGFFDDVENELHNWTVESWSRSDGKFPNSLGVLTFPVFNPPEPEDELTGQFLNDFEYFWQHRGWFLPVKRMRINPETQKGKCFILGTDERGVRNHVTVVTNHTDHILNSHYELEARLLTIPKLKIVKR